MKRGAASSRSAGIVRKSIRATPSSDQAFALVPAIRQPHFDCSSFSNKAMKSRPRTNRNAWPPIRSAHTHRRAWISAASWVRPFFLENTRKEQLTVHRHVPVSVNVDIPEPAANQRKTRRRIEQGEPDCRDLQ